MVECLKNFVDQINIGIDQELVLPAIDLKVSQDMTSDIQQSCVYTASRGETLDIRSELCRSDQHRYRSGACPAGNRSQGQPGYDLGHPAELRIHRVPG